MSFFCLDIETLDVESTTIVLSVGMVYKDDNPVFTCAKLLEDSIFVKFDIREQMRLGRTTSQETIDWWKKQDPSVQREQLLPSPNDVSLTKGIELLNGFYKKWPGYSSSMIYTRGSLDQLAIDSLFKSVDYKPLANYASYRDVRTLIDCFYPNSKNGYVEVDTEKVPDFATFNLRKHNPVDDCIIDICMMMAGKTQ